MPKDQTIELLTEIRDILKANQESLMHSKKAQQRSLVLKIVFNTAIVIFVGFATYYYYHTLVSQFGG
ncbi:hypothetical protein K8942_05060 [Candidatus Peribacteria bacterium]|nr:MAG: hypothetical protein K8942_05060 [Candidatus Peribacteria bacterium]